MVFFEELSILYIFHGRSLLQLALLNMKFTVFMLLIQHGIDIRSIDKIGYCFLVFNMFFWKNLSSLCMQSK